MGALEVMSCVVVRHWLLELKSEVGGGTVLLLEHRSLAAYGGQPELVALLLPLELVYELPHGRIARLLGLLPCR